MQVRHDADAKEFYIPLESGRAYLSYERSDSRTLDLRHTIVPEDERHQGVGSSLVEHAFRFAREAGMSIVPSCHFVRSWLTDHPEEEDLLR